MPKLQKKRSSTPCLGICSTTFGDEVCKGCKRFAHEIVGWTKYSQGEREIVNDRLEKFKIKNSSIIWINNLEKIKDGPCLFLANEFFDSFPIKQFLKKDKAWFERKVKFSRNKSLVYVDQKTNIKSLDKKIGVKLSNNQTFIEISENTIKYLKSIYKIIAKKNDIKFIWNDKFPLNSLSLMRGYLAIANEYKENYFDTCLLNSLKHSYPLMQDMRLDL